MPGVTGREVSCGGVLFDLDGVLVLSGPSVERIWLRWGEERGLDPGRVRSVMHGRRSVDAIRALDAGLDAEAESVAIDRLQAGDGAGVRGVEGAAELVGALPPDRFAVVTSARRELAEARLRQGAVPQPPLIVTGEAVEAGKPDPEGFLRGAALLGRAPEQCLVFEDAPSGVAAARAAGMRAVALTTTHSPAELGGALFSVASFAGVTVAGDGDLLRLRFPV